MAKKQVLLVAGFDYEGSGVSFPTIATNRMARLIKKFPKDKLIFILFDVGAGVISQSEITDPKKKDSMKNRHWTTLKTFTAVSSGNYSSWVSGHENAFDQSQAGTMSILDVYAFVQAIGAGADAGSVIELDFFCHGWMGGPILVNSFDPTRDDSTQPRDANDRDARTVKDFIPPTTSAAALANFSLAFALSGVIWIWGCAFARAFNIVLSRIFSTPIFKKTAPGRLKDSDRFKLDFTEDLTKTDGTSQFNSIVNNILPGGTVTPGSTATAPRSYRIDKSLLDIKTIFKTFLDASFSAVIASNTGIKTFGALLGTYADYEKIPPKSFPLMLIPRRKPPYSDNFTRSISFYKAYLKIKIDPENRGYGVFT